ncbi:MAG TPA: hypothetical protein VN682_16965 [Terriglobales bacterium]|nr:hypothetical protein [Terriglobales bacterium]
MPTCKEALEFYKKAVRDGKGDMRTGHPYIAEEEAAKREKNEPDEHGRQKTKISFDSADPDSYREWHKERKRWLTRAQNNPTLSTDAMVLGLKAYSDEAIDKIIETLGVIRARMEAERAEANGVPRAVIPQVPREDEIEPLLRRSIMMAEARK